MLEMNIVMIVAFKMVLVMARIILIVTDNGNGCDNDDDSNCCW